MAARDIHGPEAPWDDFKVVGKSHRKIDGMAKATGEAVYADDVNFGMLTRGGSEPHAHAGSSPSTRAAPRRSRCAP